MMFDRNFKHINASIGNRILIARKHAGISRVVMAEYLDVSPQYIKKVEDGMNNITAYVVYKISVLCNKPVEWFFYDLDLIGGEEIAKISDSLFSIADENVRDELIDLIKAISDSPLLHEKI